MISLIVNAYDKNLSNNVRSHWLLLGHMTSNNETAFRQNLWAGKITKKKHCKIYDFG